MKEYQFILNGVSLILILNILLNDPSITGFAVSPTTGTLALASPLGLASIFIVTTIALDIYVYLKTRKTER